MTRAGINREYYVLLDRSEELLGEIKLKQETDPLDWHEILRLQAEVDQLASKMIAMVPDILKTKDIVPADNQTRT